MTRAAAVASAGCADFRQTLRFSRRRLLQAGALGCLGLGGGTLGVQPAFASGSGGRAKSCIFLFMWGGPSQLDTFDPKPEAPAEVRGPFGTIPTRVPGLHLSEHFSRLAQQADKLTVVRSLGHDDPAHLSSGHTTLTGHLAPVVRSDAEPPSQRDTPHFGSVMARLRGPSAALPPFVTLPWLAYHPAAPGGRAPGQNGGWLGRKYDPFLLGGDPSQADWRVAELSLPADLAPGRLDDRRRLLREIDRQRARLEDQAEAATLDACQAQAFSLLASPEARAAFDLEQEPAAMRDRYGRNIHGQCVLLARRLVERGVPVVNVNWHDDGRNFWDTHGDNFNRLKNDLIPPADQALSALLADLAERGLLEQTLVCWVGEFGRRPQITANNAGREHWPFCYSGILAGGGVRGGYVHGASDRHAAYPAVDPVTPQDYLATVYRALGVDPETTFPDATGRPLRFCQGTAIHEALA